ncbi:peptide deformylase [Hippea alviniae]|uniref:peptide deformylase n=1 Tax=Hippea alviniae TaxID=1279027 RepID=UPI0003B41BC4|nr:peptide deformylase [Hippea alviniae]
MEIKVYPDRILRRKAKDVEKIDDRIIKLLDDMAQTMYKFNGIGLAAEQVGILEKLVVIDLRPDGKNQLIELINPEIIASEGIYEEHEEGCLSIPGYYDTVKDRKKWIKVKYLDRDENEQILETEDFLSVVIQHEIDHLNGKLFIDRLSPTKREFFKKQWKKIQKEREEKK